MSKSGNLAALSAIFNSNDPPTVYYSEDPPYLPRVLIFYWPVQAVGTLASTSRIRTTILSAAGFKSFGAFSVAPSSGYYAAVHKLPEDMQRDDIHRGIAFALCRYFSEVPVEVKNAINDDNIEHGVGIKWGQSHAAQITSRMSRVMNIDEVVEALRPFLKDRPTSPTTPKQIASIRKTRPSLLPHDSSVTMSRFGHSATPAKRVTSSSRRTPTGLAGQKKSEYTPTKQYVSQLEDLRYKMCEIVDTEDRYITRLGELIDLVTDQGRTAKSLSNRVSNSKTQRAVTAMLQFPALLDTIKELNLAFLDDIEEALRQSEETAVTWLNHEGVMPDGQPPCKDPMGILQFAKALHTHFPKFPVPYREYLDLHQQVSSNLDQFLKDGSTSIQMAPSLLMEPAQRISRYGLYIDTMLPHVPSSNTIAIRTLEKARKIIAEICEMEPAASTILDSLRIDYEARKRTLSPTKLISGLTRGNSIIREAPALTGTLKERDAPRLLPSLSRSFSRKNKSRPGLGGILSEQDPAQASNIQVTGHGSNERSDENRRPWSRGSGGFSLKSRTRPTTSGSNTSSGPSRPGSRDAKQYLDHSSIIEETPSKSSAPITTHERERLQKLEAENYKLLAENAELKRLIRECTCGNGRR